MKKILALVLSLVMVMGMSTTAFAATGDTLQSVPLTATVYSSYEITIPETVHLTPTNNTFDLVVSELNVAPDEKLLIIYEKSMMTSDFDNSEATLELFLGDIPVNDDKSFIFGEFTEPGSVTITGKMADGTRAGTYTGYVTFFCTLCDIDI